MSDTYVLHHGMDDSTFPREPIRHVYCFPSPGYYYVLDPDEDLREALATIKAEQTKLEK